ncbi:hypothetical protein J5I95_10110 [Candidatus Poribacteria bacterium]|nr:hypothetical protein [Candidatus Poribacteria bacterium]
MKRLYTSVFVAVICSSWFNVVSAQVIYMPDANLAAGAVVSRVYHLIAQNR